MATPTKDYNNTWADVNNYGAGNQLYGAASNHSTYATNAAELNNIYYLNFSVGSSIRTTLTPPP